MTTETAQEKAGVPEGEQLFETDAEAQAAWVDEAAKRASDNDAIDNPAPYVDPEETVEEEVAPAMSPEFVKALATINGLQSTIDQLTSEVRSSSGRVAAMQREQAAAKTVAATAASTRAPNAQTVTAASQSLEKWDRLKTDFPEWGEAVEELVSARTPATSAAPDLTQVVEDMKAQLAAATHEMESTFATRLRKATVAVSHPNWETDVKSEEFTKWAKAQGDEVKKLAESDVPADAIKMLDLYSKHNSDSTRNVATERKSKLAAAASTRRVSTAPPGGDRDKSDKEIWNEEAARANATRAQRRM